jgi:hypothetical protein
MATTITMRVEGAPAEETLDRVSQDGRIVRTFRAKTFAVRSFIAPLRMEPPIGGTHAARVTGL